MQNLPRISKQLQPMQRIPTKKPTVQKPCIDRADLEFSGLHNKKERKTLRFDVQNSGAPPGTRTLVPLIKRSQRATIVNFQNCVNLLFLSLCRKFVFCTFFAPVVPSRIRYLAVPVCKSVQSHNQPLKAGIGFLCKAGKMAGFEPKTAAAIQPV